MDGSKQNSHLLKNENYKRNNIRITCRITGGDGDCGEDMWRCD
jgi:hypothetical protein